MSDVRTIISATDLSAPTHLAAQRAGMLAQHHRAEITLMHTVRGSMFDQLRRWLAGDGEAAGRAEIDAHQRLTIRAAELSRRYRIPVRTHLAVGPLVEQVARHADDVDAGLLVTGSRSAGFFRGVVSESTAERMAKRSARPVLMVRQVPCRPYRRILVPLDFSRWSHDTIRLARQIAPDASLVLMHAVEVPFEGKMRIAGVDDTAVMRYRDDACREAQQRLLELAADVGLNPNTVSLSTPSGANASMLILQEEQTHGCDLVVMGRQGRHALDEFLLGSTTRTVIADGTADVLISSRRPD